MMNSWLKNIFDYRRQRSRRGALGFYTVHFLIIVVAMMILGPIFQPDNINEEALLELVTQFQETGEMPVDLQDYIRQISFVSAILAVTSGALFSVLVAMKKGFFKHPKILVLVLFTIAACYFFGPMIGFIPIAWMTTREPEDDGVPEGIILDGEADIDEEDSDDNA